MVAISSALDLSLDALIANIKEMPLQFELEFQSSVSWKPGFILAGINSGDWPVFVIGLTSQRYLNVAWKEAGTWCEFNSIKTAGTSFKAKIELKPINDQLLMTCYIDSEFAGETWLTISEEPNSIVAGVFKINGHNFPTQGTLTHLLAQ